MPIELLTLLALLPPIAWQLKGARPSTIFALAALGFFLVAAASIAALSLLPEQLVLRRAEDRVHHDTYYVAIHIHHILGMLLVPAGLWAILKVKERVTGFRYERPIAALLWGVLLGLAAMLLVPSLFARWFSQGQDIDHFQALATLNTVSFALAYFSLACLLGLLVLTAVAFVGHWRDR